MVSRWGISFVVVAVMAGGAARGGAQSAQCKPGFVMRGAAAGDQVCVTPQEQAQAQADNRAAGARHVAGSDACIQGWVWRGATPQDHVCVTAQARAQVQADNQLAGARAAGGVTAAMMMRGGRAPAQIIGSAALPGFHMAAMGEIKTAPPASVRVHPRPEPLSAFAANAQLHKLNPNLGNIRLGGGPPQISYQLENYTANSAAEVNTTSVSSSILLGAPGYVQVNFTVSPGTQYMLDCSLGQDGTFSVGTTFLSNNTPPYSVGTVSSFNRHLMIPLNPTPKGAESAQVVINFTQIEFDGCQVDTVQ